MRTYEVKHKCGTKLGFVDDSYTGGFYPYCKNCKDNISVTPVKVENPELKFKIISACACACADNK